jgi:hypothetical protein
VLRISNLEVLGLDSKFFRIRGLRLEFDLPDGVLVENRGKQAHNGICRLQQAATQASVGQHARKKWCVMRRMAFSMVLAGVIVGGLAAGPDDAIHGMRYTARGQDPFERPAAEGAKSGRENDERKMMSDARERIEAALNRPTTLEVAEMPLKDVVIFLQETHGIPIHVRRKKLEDAGISLDQPISISLRGIPLRSALDLLLGDIELTYAVKDVLLLTTPENAAHDLETRVYDCRDLLAMTPPEISGQATPASSPAEASYRAACDRNAAAATPGMGCGSVIPTSRRHGSGGTLLSPSSAPPTEAEKRMDWLIGLIRATVNTDSWDDVGGGGTIDAYNGLLVVSQSYQTHRALKHLLDDLRSAARTDAAGDH